MRTISLAGVLSALVASQCFAQVSPKTTGTIRGTIFTSSNDGVHALVPHATIHLEGPDTRDTQSDEQGAHLFESVEPGSYVVTGTAPGLTGTVHVQLAPGATSLAK